MINKDRVDSIIEAINENGISAFNDESLVKLLSMLTISELYFLIENSFTKLGYDAFLRLKRIRPAVEYEIRKTIYKIKSGKMFEGFLDAKNKNTIRDYVYNLNREELCDLKKVINHEKNKDSKSGVNKLIELISEEIRKKDELTTKNLGTK